MLQRQQLTAFILLVDTQMVRLTSHQQLPSTKTTIGKLLVTWLKLEIIMVQSHPDLQQWLLVVCQTVDQRKCIFERYRINCIFSMLTELWDLDSFENQIIDPTLPTNYIMPGLFLVDIGFCAKND